MVQKHIVLSKSVFLRTAVILLFSLILAGLIELGFNYPAICGGYSPIDITANKTDNGSQIIYTFEPEEAVYVKKIQLSGDYVQTHSYYVSYTLINDFDKEEEEEKVDYIYPEIPVATSMIDAKVKKVEISMDSSIQVDSVRVSNEFTVNKYRLLLFFLTIFFIALLWLDHKLILKKLEVYFAVYALAMGAFLILIAGPGTVTWDENVHYGRVYRIASNKTVEWSKSAWEFYNRDLPDYNSKDEFAQLKYYLNQNEGTELAKTEKKEQLIASYDQRIYYPMACFYEIGKLLHLPFTYMYMLGKLGNLLIYVLVLFWAIRMARGEKIFITAISMMPTVLFQGAMYTYDGLVYAFLVLGCVLWKREYDAPNKIITWQSTLAIILCFVVGSLPKAVYIPLILMILLFPKTKFRTPRNSRNFKVIIVFLFLLVMCTFVMPAISNTVAGNLAYGGDTRGGDTSTVRQLISMLQHPVSSVKLVLSSIISLENFRNVGREALDNVIASNLAFLAFGGNGVLNAKWSLFLLPLLCVLFFIPSKENERNQLSVKGKISLGVIVFMILVLIWVALYLSFTPVGMSSISGVQVRYYLPILLPLAYITWGHGFKSNLKIVTYRRMVLTFVNVFMFQCIYQLFLKFKCW